MLVNSCYTTHSFSSRYVRVVGVYNSMNRSFHLVSFACLHTSRPFQLNDEGLISEYDVIVTYYIVTMM